MLLPSSALASAALVSRTPLSGPYETRHSTLQVPDPLGGTIDLYEPLNTTQPSRLVSFAHGAEGGTIVLPVVYHSLLHSLAAWGYVVAATRSCFMGTEVCRYYEHQLKVIEFARGEASKGVAPFASLNFSGGVGIAGHSMGGEATLFSSEASHASAYNISAAVMLHAYTHVHPAPSVPFLAFTGTTDTTAAMSMSEKFYAAASPTLPRGLVEKINATHQEPTDYNDGKEPVRRSQRLWALSPAVPDASLSVCGSTIRTCSSLWLGGSSCTSTAPPALSVSTGIN